MSELSNILRDAIKAGNADPSYNKLSASEKEQTDKLFLVMNACSDEIDRLEDIVATLRQETEGFREVVIAKHGQIERLEDRNARLLAALSPFANKRTCECMQFIGKHLVFGAGKKCDYCNAADL